MFFKHALALAALAASALAQGVIISQPPASSTVSPGESITVQITRPDTLTGSTEVAVALALVSCPGDNCANIDVSQRLGTVLYHGLYAPQRESVGSDQGWPYENFTVTVPEGFAAGAAALSCSHFSLVGAGPYPFLEVVNTTLNVQN